MNDFHKHISSKPPDPYEKIHVSGIEQKRGKDEHHFLHQKRRKIIFLISLLQNIKKMIFLLFSFNKKKNAIYNLKATCKSLKDNFQKLENDDLSNNFQFLKDLSDSWKNFIVSYEYEYLKNEKHNKIIEKLIFEVNHYYGKQEFTFGFYLLKYGKQRWHPFPFINLLKTLHREYREMKSTKIFKKEILEKTALYPKNAPSLEKWVFLLDKII